MAVGYTAVALQDSLLSYPHLSQDSDLCAPLSWGSVST